MVKSIWLSERQLGLIVEYAPGIFVMMDAGRDPREGIFSLELIVSWLLAVAP